MNKKLLSLMLATMLAAFSAQAQTMEKNLDKLAKDPKMAEEAAKADVYILDHKIYNDSSTQQKSKTAAATKKKARKNKPHHK